MKYDLSQPISQRGIGEKDAENRRIKEISDELQRLCRLHEAQPRTGQEDRGRFEIEQERICNALPATQIMIDTYMSALDFSKENDEGRYSNGTYLVWDVVPRNVLVDADGDMYVIDAEIKKL